MTALAHANNQELMELAIDNQVVIEEKRFELEQRKAQVYAKSSLVPKEYQNNIGNVLIASNMARRMNSDVLMVMQNLYIVHGKPGWSAQFLIGCFNSNGRFSAIKYRFTGTPNTPDWGCQAYCTEIATGEEISGTTITLAMANAEGWASKAGSKWKTMPEQMFRYRAATFLIRATAPEIGLGLLTKEELEDSEPMNGNSPVAFRTVERIADLKERFAEPEQLSAPADEPEAIDAEPVDVINEPPTDLDATTESLRAEVQDLYDRLEKDAQKDFIAGKTAIGKATYEELDEYRTALLA